MCGAPLTHPVICWLGATSTLVAWHIPAVFVLGLRSQMCMGLESQASFLATGLPVLVPVLQPSPNSSQVARIVDTLVSIPRYLPCIFFPVLGLLRPGGLPVYLFSHSRLDCPLWKTSNARCVDVDLRYSRLRVRRGIATGAFTSRPAVRKITRLGNRKRSYCVAEDDVQRMERSECPGPSVLTEQIASSRAPGGRFGGSTLSILGTD